MSGCFCCRPLRTVTAGHDSARPSSGMPVDGRGSKRTRSVEPGADNSFDGRPADDAAAGRNAGSAHSPASTERDDVDPFATNPCRALNTLGAKAAAILGRRKVRPWPAPPPPRPPPPPSCGRSPVIAAIESGGRSPRRILASGCLLQSRPSGIRTVSIELLEHQPRPTFVHVAAAVALIHREPRLANLICRSRRERPRAAR